MNIPISRLATRLVLPVLAAAVLGGCAVVPNDGYYGSASYNSSVYVTPAPVYFGLNYRSGPRYYPRHYQQYRPHRPGPRHYHPRPRPGGRR